MPSGVTHEERALPEHCVSHRPSSEWFILFVAHLEIFFHGTSLSRDANNNVRSTSLPPIANAKEPGLS